MSTVEEGARVEGDRDHFRISLESLKRYAPVYQDSLEAKKELDAKFSHADNDHYHVGDPDSPNLSENDIDPADVDAVMTVTSLESRYHRGQFALEKLVEQATPLLHSEVAKIASKAAFHDAEEVHPVLFYEAVTGLKKGLAKYDASKNIKSVTNYLFQWATTYAKRELNKLEAPFGVPPSRYEKYKKVSAVRSKLTESLGRYASNQEVLEYFHSGSADIKTFNGPVALKDQGSRANKEIDLKLIEDQEYFEKNLAYTKYLHDETGEFYPDNILPVHEEFIAGERSIFRDFVDAENFSDNAHVVILNETQQNVPTSALKAVENVPESEYKQIVKEFRALIRERDGSFHRFILDKLEEGDIAGYDVDIRGLARTIEETPQPKNRKRYRILYRPEEEEENNDSEDPPASFEEMMREAIDNGDVIDDRRTGGSRT